MSQWTTRGTEILKDGQPIFLSGVCYAPTPAGAGVFKPGVGDWFAPPWNSIWERDLPLMKAAGIDNLRTYFTWAWTPPDDMTTWRSVTGQPPTFDHTAFLDCAATNGVSVTLGIALDGGNIFDNGDPSLAQDYLNFYTATAASLADSYGNHDAVMGFCLANEQNNPSRIVRPAFWNAFATMAAAVRANAPDKLVMCAMQNDPAMLTATLAGTSTTVPERFAQIFDVWGINVYAGMATTLSSYASHVAQDAATQRPLIVSEWGIAAGVNVPAGAAGPPDGTATARELTAAEFATRIAQRMDPDGAAMKQNRTFLAGAQYFEWSDEWWKNGATPIDEQNASASPDWPEEWWGLHAIAPVGRTAAQGPWDAGAGKPFPADALTARPTLAALSKIYVDVAAG